MLASWIGRSVCLRNVITTFSRLSVRDLHVSNLGVGGLSNRPGILHPNGYDRSWIFPANGIDLSKYTHHPLPYPRWGGRGPNGRIELKHISGGLRRPYFMVDLKRSPLADGGVKHERVLYIHKNWWRTPFLALVAHGEEKRWIIATSGMKAGDIIRTFSDIPEVTVDAVPGDAHPVGALPVGTIVSQVSVQPGAPAKHALESGSHCTLVKKMPPTPLNPEATCLLRMRNKKEFIISEKCIVVVGMNSNEDRDKKFYKFGQKRWLGIKQRSGLYQKKTGRFGRKIHAPGPAFDYLAPVYKPLIVSSTYKPYFKAWEETRRSHIHKHLCEGEQTNPRFKWCDWATYDR